MLLPAPPLAGSIREFLREIIASLWRHFLAVLVEGPLLVPPALPSKRLGRPSRVTGVFPVRVRGRSSVHRFAPIDERECLT